MKARIIAETKAVSEKVVSNADVSTGARTKTAFFYKEDTENTVLDQVSAINSEVETVKSGPKEPQAMAESATDKNESEYTEKAYTEGVKVAIPNTSTLEAAPDSGLCRRPVWHNGYIVTLNTLARFYPDTKEDVANYCDMVNREAKKGKKKEFKNHLRTYLTFGEFDRISFNGVDRFSRYFDLDARSKYWLGKHQSVFLYQIDPENTEPHLYPYMSEDFYDPESPGDCTVDDYGFCVNSSPESWYLFSSVNRLNTPYQNTNQTVDAFYPFFVFSQISLSNAVLNRTTDFGTFLKCLRLKLREQLDRAISSDSHKWNIQYEIFGCLNTSEISILWLTDQYSNVLFLIDELKKMKFSIWDAGDATMVEADLFFSFYSIIGRMLANDKAVADDEKGKIESCRGTAQIDIMVSSTSSVSELSSILKKELLGLLDSSIRVGEHDCMLRLPVKDIYDQFFEEDINSEKNGLFKKPSVRDKILETRVALLEDTNERPEDISLMTICFEPECGLGVNENIEQFKRLFDELNPILENPGDKENLKIKEMYLWIRDALRERYMPHLGAIDTLDMLYTDYLSNIHESYSAIWRNDFSYQFKQSLRILISCLKIEEEKGAIRDTFWKQYPQIIENIRQQTVHFSQSGRLVLQPPSSHLRYTACCDLLFHGYYGMIKSILADAYGKQEPSVCQSELLPLITTNSDTEISSSLFFVGPRNNDLRILCVDIPYSLLYDPVAGFPMMVHEMFHYIAPSDRVARNRVVGNVLINETLTRLYLEQINESVKLELYKKERNLFYQKRAIDPGYQQEFPYESPFDSDFEEKFESMMKNFSDGENNYDVMEKIWKSLKKIMWNDETISKIRERILESVLQDEYGEKTPLTWTLFLERLEDKLKGIKLHDYKIISERLLEIMTEYENSDSGKKEPVLFLGGTVNYDVSGLNEIDQIMYRHKRSILNPNSIKRVRGTLEHIAMVRDCEINGLREASPDIAMAKYCQMDDIAYLVNYAHHAGKSSSYFERYEVIRIAVVLSWLSEEPVVEENDQPKPFKFEEKSCQFIKEYILKNLPNNLPQDPAQAEQRIIKLVADAVTWFCKYLSIAAEFRTAYSFYYDEFIAYGNCYKIYFSEDDDTEREPLLNKLITVLKEGKTDKTGEKVLREELLTEDVWERILKASESYIKDYKKYRVYNPPSYEDIERDMIRTLSTLGLDRRQYANKTQEYNKRSFETALRFVQQASVQGTLEQLGGLVKSGDFEQRNPSSKETKLSDEYPTPKETDDILEKATVIQAWGMTEFTLELQRVSEKFGLLTQKKPQIWYGVTFGGRRFLPTAVSENACTPRLGDSHSAASLFEQISDDMREYIQVKDPFLNYSSQNEVIPMMTVTEKVEGGNWKSNMILWKGHLIDCLKKLKGTKGMIEVYFFSPEAYLKVRKYVLMEHPDKKKVEEEPMAPFNVLAYTKIPIVFESSSSYVRNEYYIPGAETEKLIDSAVDSQQNALARTDIYLPLVLPVPFIFTGMKENCRFLTYNLALSARVGELDEVGSPQLSVYPIEEIQRMLIHQIRRIKMEKKEPFVITDWLFLYRICIDEDILKGINDINI